MSYSKAVLTARTESHRNQEAGMLDCAKEISRGVEGSGLIYTATWRTMLDERVRPNHRYHTKTGWKTVRRGKADHQKMEGKIIRVGDRFDLGDGVYAEAPGSSGVAAHDCNCRCYLEYALMTPEEFVAAGGKLEEKEFTNPNDSDIMQSSGKVGDRDEDTVITDVYDIPPTKEAAQKEIDSFVDSFAYAPEEHSMVISPSGHVTVLSGGMSTIKTQLAGADQLKGAIVIHNHPLGPFAVSYDDSFSKEDFIFAARFGCGRQYVVSGTLKNAFEFLEPVTFEEMSSLYEEAKQLAYSRAYAGLLDMNDYYLAICRVIPDVTKKVAFYEF